MKHIFKSARIIVLLVALLSMNTAVFAQDPGPTAGADSQVVTKRSTPAKQKDILAFWTRERIANAQPMPLLTLAGSPEFDLAAEGQMEVTGALGIVAPGLAAADADQVARAAFAEDWAATEEFLGELTAAEPLVPEGTEGVYSSYTVNSWAPAQNIYPHKWVGRLSFTVPGGTGYCSGTAINGNVVVTAAHCLYDSTNNTWYNNWAFTPAYRNGSAPYGSFPYTACRVLVAWVNLSGDYDPDWFRWDVGVCQMGTNASGQTLNQAVGWAGRIVNSPYVRHFHNLGYPFRNYNDTLLSGAGQYLRTCASESFFPIPEARGAGCNYGRGISGGPWMTAYAPPAVSGYVEGVNSGGYIGYPTLYAPRFNNNNIVALCSGWC